MKHSDIDIDIIIQISECFKKLYIYISVEQNRESWVGRTQYIYEQLIFNKGTKTVKWEKIGFSGKGAKVISFLYVYTKSTKWIIDQNWKPKKIQLLVENIGESFCDLMVGKSLRYCIKSINHKKRNWSIDLKMKNICSLKDVWKRMKEN